MLGWVNWRRHAHPYWEIVSVCWVAFWLYWSLSAFRVRVQRRQASLRFTIPNTLLLYLGFVLALVGRTGPGRFSPRFTPDAAWIEILGVALVVAGVALAVWSRSVLGTNWSARVRIIQSQRLVTNGPYAVIRNPIYSGMSLAVLGTALVAGTVASIIGFVLVFASLWWKGRVEERFLLEAFRDEYATYRRRVKALIPFIL